MTKDEQIIQLNKTIKELNDKISVLTDTSANLIKEKETKEKESNDYKSMVVKANKKFDEYDNQIKTLTEETELYKRGLAGGDTVDVKITPKDMEKEVEKLLKRLDNA